MPKKTGFTLIELLVVISIIALLVSILVPSLQQARSQAQSAVCKVNLHSVGIGIETYKSERDITVDKIWQWGGGTADNCHEYHDAGIHQSLVDDYEILPDREIFFCPSVTNLSFDHNYVYNNTTPMNEYQMLQVAPTCSYDLSHPFHVAWLAKMQPKGITNHFYFWSSYIWFWTKFDSDHDPFTSVYEGRTYRRGGSSSILQVNHASDDVLMGEMSPSVYGIVELDEWTIRLNIKPPLNHYNALFLDSHVEQVAGTDTEYNMWLWDSPYWAGNPEYAGYGDQ